MPNLIQILEFAVAFALIDENTSIFVPNLHSFLKTDGMLQICPLKNPKL